MLIDCSLLGQRVMTAAFWVREQLLFPPVIAGEARASLTKHDLENSPVHLRLGCGRSKGVSEAWAGTSHSISTRL